MKWGKEDCLTDLFGAEAHKKISWVKETHEETLGWVLTLSESDRLNLFRATAEGQGYIRVDDPKPGDGAIGHFELGVCQEFDLPSPWFAQMWTDCNWYVRLPNSIRTVDFIGEIEVYRCRRLQ